SLEIRQRFGRFNHAKATPALMYAIGRASSTVFVSQSWMACSSHGRARANSPVAVRGNARPVYAHARAAGASAASPGPATGVAKSPLELTDCAQTPGEAMAAKDIRGAGGHAETLLRGLCARSLEVTHEGVNGRAIFAPPVMSASEDVAAQDPQRGIPDGGADV